VEEIAAKARQAIDNKEMVTKATFLLQKKIKPILRESRIKEEVIEKI
jgi:hypothetical protein